MSAIDELVRQWMEKVERSGEMRGIAGKPLDLDDGYEQTPQELRMAQKILKNADILPAEVEHMQGMEALRKRLAETTDATTQLKLQRELAELETKLRVRLEHLRRSS